MNNFLSYCGLVDTRISASEKDLLVMERLRQFLGVFSENLNFLYRFFIFRYDVTFSFINDVMLIKIKSSA